MSNRAYEETLKRYEDEHRFDDKEVVEYWVGSTKFRSLDSARDYCWSNGCETNNIRKEVYKVNWQGSRI